MVEHKGDSGTTLNYRGQRVPKDDHLIVISGSFDSLLSALDLSLLYIEEKKARNCIEHIQKKLWQSAGEVSLGEVGKNVREQVTEEDTKQMESWMNSLTPLPSTFIRFTKHASVYLNEARVRCRKLEIELTPLLREAGLRQELFTFMNRLSLFLFHLGYHLEKN